VACFETTVQANWLQNFISGLGVVDNVSKPLKICCDNFTTVFSKTDMYSKGVKHMELKYFVVKEEVHKRKVSIEHISTNLMIVDPLTKGLPPKLYAGHVKNMNIMSTGEC